MQALLGIIIVLLIAIFILFCVFLVNFEAMCIDIEVIKNTVKDMETWFLFDKEDSDDQT